MKKYVIIDAEAIQQKIEEWQAELRKCFEAPVGEFNHDYAITLQQAIDTARELSSQSTPLIPEIEKAFNAGFDADLLTLAELNCTVKDYIANLKLDI